MNTKMLVSRVWATTGLSFKVKKLIDEKTRRVLEETRIADESEYSKKKIDSYTVPNKAKLKIPYWNELE